MRIEEPMNKNNLLRSMLKYLTPGLLAAVLLTACSTTRSDSRSTLFDFGLLPAAQPGEATTSLPPLAIADANTPSSMRGGTMTYRLAYANAQQPQPYVHSRWSAPPAQLFVQRLKARIARAGGTALPASDGAVNVPTLRIDADDFTQIFDSPGNSVGQVSLRVAVFQGRNLVAQKSFTRQAPAPSPDAAGGAKALAEASDAAISDILSWLAGLPLKR
jgi:cholesterol transport system auxiliary component